MDELITSKEIIQYLDSNYNYKDTLSNLSSNKLIKSTEQAYDYDKIKNVVYKGNCASCDALLIKKNINIIEFKTGFDSPDDTLDDKTKKENLMLKIRLKAYESLHLLYTAIIEEIDSTRKIQPKKIFCAVIDTNEMVTSEEAIVDILSEEGAVKNNSSYKTRIIENMLTMYRKETDHKKKLFYDDTFVLYDYEFDSNVNRFK